MSRICYGRRALKIDDGTGGVHGVDLSVLNHHQIAVSTGRNRAALCTQSVRFSTVRWALLRDEGVLIIGSEFSIAASRRLPAKDLDRVMPTCVGK